MAAADGGEMLILHLPKKAQKCTLFPIEAIDTCVQIKKEFKT